MIRVASIDTESHRLDAGSNRGAWVDVAASAELSAHGSGSAPVGNGGTSAAAAAVSAISGLLLSCNAALTPAHVKDILMRTSTPYDVDVVARGEVDAYRAVLSSGCPEPVATVQSVERVKLTVLVQGGGTVSRQPAGAPTTPGTLVTLEARPRSAGGLPPGGASAPESARPAASRSTARSRSQPCSAARPWGDDAPRISGNRPSPIMRAISLRFIPVRPDRGRPAYLISVSSLNIGRYMLMITTPTMIPTPSIMIGSTIEVSDWIEASTSSS